MENYEKIKFIECGFDKQFTLIGNGKNRTSILVECKECGCNFNESKSAFYVSKKLTCRECGVCTDGSYNMMRRLEYLNARKYYEAGHSVKETAEKFNTTKDTINNWVKKNGYSNGIDWHCGGCNYNNKRKEDALDRLKENLKTKGFTYIDGYDDKYSKINIKCNVCGINRSIKTESVRRAEKILCQNCEKENTAIRRIEAKRKQQEQSAERKAEKRILKQALKKEEQEIYKKTLNECIYTCKICGKTFSISDYISTRKDIKQIHVNGKHEFCSVNCQRKYQNRLRKASKKRLRVNDNHHHRAKKYGCEYNSKITLAGLIKRDGLKCAICGDNCKLDDHSWSKYAGPLYPSIDHIIPMSKGGGHTWDNVQIAHIICNSKKGATVI